jgi:hypothetical protein
MKNKTFKCPNCGDTWEYEMVVDHSGKKCVVTKNYDFIEDGQDCTCFKCHAHYQMKITSPSDVKMDDFIYNVWRHCKM